MFPLLLLAILCVWNIVSQYRETHVQPLWCSGQTLCTGRVLLRAVSGGSKLQHGNGADITPRFGPNTESNQPIWWMTYCIILEVSHFQWLMFDAIWVSFVCLYIVHNDGRQRTGCGVSSWLWSVLGTLPWQHSWPGRERVPCVGSNNGWLWALRETQHHIHWTSVGWAASGLHCGSCWWACHLGRELNWRYKPFPWW